jgi:hypothetical protein
LETRPASSGARLGCPQRIADDEKISVATISPMAKPIDVSRRCAVTQAAPDNRERDAGEQGESVIYFRRLALRSRWFRF